MADLKKQVDLEFNVTGSAADKMRGLAAEAEKVRRSGSGGGAAGGSSGGAGAPTHVVVDKLPTPPPRERPATAADIEKLATRPTSAPAVGSFFQEAQEKKQKDALVRSEAADRAAEAARKKEAADKASHAIELAKSVPHGLKQTLGTVQGGGGGLARGAGAGLAVMAALEVGLDKAAKAAEIFSAPAVTGAQKMRALFAEFAPAGHSILKLADAIDGTTKRIYASEAHLARESARLGVEASYAGRIRQAEYEWKGAVATAGAIDRIPYAAGQTFDRGTVGGQIKYQEYQMRQPAQDEVVRAQRGAEASRSQKEKSDRTLSGLNARVEAARKARDTAEKEALAGVAKENKSGLASVSDKGGRIEQENRLRERQLELDNLLKLREEEIARNREAGIKSVEAESQVRKANIALAQAEANILKGREQRVEQASSRAGHMSRGEFNQNARALAVVRKAEAEGKSLDTLPPQILEAAGRLSPEAMERRRQKLGEDRIRGQLGGVIGEKGLEEEFGDTFRKGETLKGLRQQTQQAEVNVRTMIQLDEAKTAQEIAKALGPFVQGLIQSVRIAIEQEMGKVDSGMRKRAAGSIP